MEASGLVLRKRVDCHQAIEPLNLIIIVTLSLLP